MVDSIRKKVKVVEDMIQSLKLHNATAQWSRVENMNDKYDFVVSRAVAPFSDLFEWTGKHVEKHSFNKLKNGLIALKGGDLSTELKNYPDSKIYCLSDYFDEEYFTEKKIVYMPV
ncbi:MAG TPA: hypothetical protein DEQ09_05920 [Bacteroidales bacterium]|nr:hypothetical protein [Bacteroidales bacterium]